MYTAEKYKNTERFNEQYEEIYQFLLDAAKLPCNEHFPFGRMEWMLAHSYLETDKLTNITLFRDEKKRIVGMITYDTCYMDRSYILHSTLDEQLLREMIEYIEENEREEIWIKVNSKDQTLKQILASMGYTESHKEVSLLELSLEEELVYSLPEGYEISPKDFEPEDWKYQMVIHRGFNHEDIPKPLSHEMISMGPHKSKEFTVFTLRESEYTSHCGIWYTVGASSYIEPVVTDPKHRRLGLSKACVYEACNRTRAHGALRATVLSDDPFYKHIGFTVSSEVYAWRKQ